MTTKTAEPAQETLVDAAARAEEQRQAKQLDTVNPAAAGFNEFQLAVRRMLGLEDASEGEMRLFWHLCQKSGLDPFNREIYMIGRNTEVARYVKVDPNDPNSAQRKEVRQETKYTVQVAINGFRKRAREIADSKGIKLGMGEPLWCGDDGVWREIWPDKTPPTAAKFTVFRDGEPFPFIAHYSEYVQYSGAGEPTSMWKKMPRNQTRKCAEANAIQMAFPDELGGLVLEDAAQPDIIDSDGNQVTPEPARRPGKRGRGTSGLREAAVAEQASQQPGPEPGDSTRRKWLNRMFQLLNEAQCSDRGEQLIVIIAAAHAAGIPDLQLEHRDALTDEHLRAVVTQLNKWEKAGELGNQIREAINIHDIRAEAGEQQTFDTEGGQS